VLHWMRPTLNLLVLRFGVRRLAAAFPARTRRGPTKSGSKLPHSKRDRAWDRTPRGPTKAGASSRTPKRLPFLTGGALVRTRQAPHELDDARVLPVNGSDDFLGHSPAPVEDVSLREYEGTIAAGQDLLRVARNREGQALREHESFERCLVLVHADADHRHTIGAHLLGELLETRRLLHAGR